MFKFTAVLATVGIVEAKRGGGGGQGRRSRVGGKKDGGDPRNAMAMAMKYFDKDKSGGLDRKEFASMMSKGDEKMDPKAVDVTFKLADANRDGQVTANEMNKLASMAGKEDKDKIDVS